MLASSSSSTGPFGRRDFLGRASQWRALLAAYQPLPAPSARRILRHGFPRRPDAHCP